MKIYCILLDATPENSKSIHFFDDRHFQRLHQISNCFTITSLVSMLTSYMPSDLIKGGIGYNSNRNYWRENGQVHWPFEDKYILSILKDHKWDIEIHVPIRQHYRQWFLESVSSRYKVTSVENRKMNLKEMYRCWSLDNEMLNDHILEEKSYIKKIQSEDVKNKFYLFAYNYYHFPACQELDHLCPMMMEKQLNVLSSWDFDEEDALFWIFSDHDCGLNFDYKCQPIAFNMWAQVKDNTKYPLCIESRYTSIRDFAPTVLRKLGISHKCGDETYSIEMNQDSDRIYYVEDSRMANERWKSVTFVACKFGDWVNGVPRRLVSVSYCNKVYYCYELNLADGKYVELKEVDESLKSNLMARFKKLI